MNLGQQTTEFARWARQVMGVFLGVRLWTTLGVIAAEAISDITRLLAFFMPLKIILLAGSDGVPRYFPFIDPAQKMPWIIGLAVGAFVAYGVTLVLDALAERLSEGASSDVLEGANEMALSSNQHEQAQSAYSGFCRICANALFTIVGGAAIAVVKPEVAAFLAVAIVTIYGLTAGIVAGDDDIRPGPIKAWVRNRLGAYLAITSSVTFLLGFVVLLLPYLFGAGGNILLTILTIIILRQLLGAVTGIAKSATSLSKQRDRINAQVFRDQPQQKTEKGHLRTLRELFQKDQRQQRTNRLLAELWGADPQADVTWEDAPRPFVTTLAIGPVENCDGARYLQQQIYPAQRRVHLENEAFLFRYIERERLHAPAQWSRFEEEPFECQIVDYGQGRCLTPQQWKEQHITIIADVLACVPPPRMVAAYRRSNRLLGDRVDASMLDRFAIAVDTEDERATLAELNKALPRVRDRLERLPLCIDNRDLDRATTCEGGGGEPLVMLWGRWSLEPLGGLLLTASHNIDSLELLPRLIAERSDFPEILYTEDIELARLCAQLELQDEKTRYKAALDLIPAILENLATERTARAA